MSRSSMFRYLFSKHALTYCTVLGFMLLLALIVGVLVDIRWFVVAAMIAFIIAPMIMTFLYFNHGLHPGYTFNILPHTITLRDDCIEVDVYVPDEADVNDVGDLTDEADVLAVGYQKEIGYSSLLPYTVHADAVSFPLKDGGMLWIPVCAFPDRNFSELIKLTARDIDGVRNN